MVIVPGRADHGAARSDMAAAERPSPPTSSARARLPRVLVVDAQPLVVEALAGLLARPPLGATPLTASRSDAALELLRLKPADLVLCDLRVQPVPFRDFVAGVRGLLHCPPVILLGGAEDQVALVGAIHLDVAGVFTKDSDPDEFLEGVRAVLAGHRAVGDNLMRHLVARFDGTPAPVPRPGLSHLSPTELGILAMVGAASSVEEIAQARGISPKTVRNHLANIYRKLDLRSRTEAMLCAARMGLTAP